MSDSPIIEVAIAAATLIIVIPLLSLLIIFTLLRLLKWIVATAEMWRNITIIWSLAIVQVQTSNLESEKIFFWDSMEMLATTSNNLLNHHHRHADGGKKHIQRHVEKSCRCSGSPKLARDYIKASKERNEKKNSSSLSRSLSPSRAHIEILDKVKLSHLWFFRTLFRPSGWISISKPTRLTGCALTCCSKPETLSLA